MQAQEKNIQAPIFCPSRRFEVDDLLHPLRWTEFFRDYWECQLIHVPRGQAGYFESLFSVRALEQVLQCAQVKPPAIRVVKNQVEKLPALYQKADGSIHMNQLYKAYDEGHSIIINGLQQFWPPLADFCNRLQRFLSHAVIANCYFSPAHSKALDPHYDTHDVFVVQLGGAKTWKLHETNRSVPLLNSFQPIIPEPTLGEPTHEIVMQPGDVMYIPRGLIHHAETADTFSFHMTIGVYPTQWMDLMTQALTALSCQDERFRRALPPGFLETPQGDAALRETFGVLLAALKEKANFQDAMTLQKQQLIQNSLPAPDGHFEQVNELNQVASQTMLEKRQNMMCHILDKGLSVSLQFPGNTINGPLSYRRAMQFVVEVNGPFAVGQLPQLEPDKQIKLARRLIRGGLLQISPASN